MAHHDLITSYPISVAVAVTRSGVGRCMRIYSTLSPIVQNIGKGSVKRVSRTGRVAQLRMRFYARPLLY